MYGIKEAESYVEEGIVGLAVAVTLAFAGMTLLGGTDIIGNAVVLQQGPDLLQSFINLLTSNETVNLIGGFLQAFLDVIGGFFGLGQ